MKKLISSLLASVVLITGCLFGFYAYAADGEAIDSAIVELNGETYTYTASQIKPAVTVRIGSAHSENQTESVTLEENRDYRLTYENNIDAGTGKVVIEGIGAYSGTAEKTFTILPRSISSGDIKVTTVSKATPKVAPKIKVTYKSKTIVNNKDYTVKFENYAKAGVSSAKAILTGKGNFTGTKTVKLHVYPNKVTSISVKERKTDSITLSWKSQSAYSVTGYKVYTCDSKGNNQKLYKTVSSNTCKVTKLKAGEYKYFKIRAYKTADKKTIYGDYSGIFKTVVKPAKITLNSVSKSKDKKKLVVKWKKTGCTGYEIQYTTDKKFKKGVKTVKIKSSSTQSKSISIPKSNKTYYVRVRAYRQYNNNKTKINGSWSNSLSTTFNKVYATYSTTYSNNKNRVNNLKLACKAIDGVVLKPGETFSFDKVVGKRTAKRGYKPATVFTGSNGHAMSVGGGVCQVASTLFNTTLISNLSVVERYQHSQKVSYVPSGRDAAISWGTKNYRFKNNSGYPIKIKMSCKNGRMTCKFYVSYDVSPKKVSLKVNRKGKKYTLKRYVGGKCNYTTTSVY